VFFVFFVSFVASVFVSFVFFVAFVIVSVVAAQGTKSIISSQEVAPFVELLRDDLIPAELRGKSTSELASIWPKWAAERNAAIRARVEGGDEDSIAYFALFGISFTKRPRVTERELASLVTSPEQALASLKPRIDDFLAAAAMPGVNERLQFANQLFTRKGFDLSTPVGKDAARRFLDERMRAIGSTSAARSSTLLDPAAAALDTQTLFRNRGLSSDTSIFIDYGIDETMAGIVGRAAIRTGTIRRVAVIGPGLDFTDKLEGYDFYPQQTIQPFAVIDSLMRYGLADPDGVDLVAFDLSPRVLQHLETARTRARQGMPYTVVLPRNTDRPWTSELVDYWERCGNFIGEPRKGAAAPPEAGHVDVRTVAVRPGVVLAITASDVNIVLERVETEPFDLIVATNILLYYDVFEQSLAVANIAKMLRPGGFLLTNNAIFEVPPNPIRRVGATDVKYMSLTGIGDTGDRILWYQRD
jgi:hypothetical protein